MNNAEIRSNLEKIANSFINTQIVTQATLSSMDNNSRCHNEELLVKLTGCIAQKVDFVDMSKVKIHAVFSKVGTYEQPNMLASNFSAANIIINGTVEQCLAMYMDNDINQTQLEAMYKERILLKQLIGLDRKRYSHLEARSQEIKMIINSGYTASIIPTPVLFSLYNIELAQKITANSSELIHELIKDLNDGQQNNDKI